MFRTLIIIITAVQAHSSIPCRFIDTVNITGGHKDLNLDYIFKGDIFPYGTYEEFNYVEDYARNKTKVDPHIRGCICNIKPCIRLCCKGVQDDIFPHCGDSDVFIIRNGYDEDEEIVISDNKFGMLIGRPCAAMYEFDGDYEEERWNLLNNGSLNTMNRIIDIDSYCLGITSENEAKAYACFMDKEKDYRFTVYPIGMLISLPFLFITFLVYAFIPELRNLHGKCLMFYTLSLIMLYSTLITAQWYTSSMEQELCIFIGYLLYVSVLLCFFWMNIMCFDIWRILRNGMTHRSITKERKSFGIYCIYAFGSTTLITALVMFIDFYEIFPTKYLPLVGHRKCWIQTEFIAEAIYVYCPISIIIITNTILFVDTARKIWKASKDIEGNDVQKRKRIVRRRFFIYLRLFILMGLTWCMETISWMYNNDSKLFYVTDFFNCLQGLVIFLICVCDVRTRRAIAKKFCSSVLSNEESSTYAADCSVTETVKLNDVK